MPQTPRRRPYVHDNLWSLSKSKHFVQARSSTCRSLCLNKRGGQELSAEYLVPETAGDAEAQLVVEEVVSEVILLEVLVPQGQVVVMEEVVGQVVADVTEDATAEYGCS